jgi:ADP-heptose:LPS heptosyltransferase
VKTLTSSYSKTIASFTLRQVLVLYTRSEILVTSDSGPAHFASMTPIRVVTLSGSETPALFCRAIAKCDRLLGRHRLQPVRERLQQPAIGLPQQSLYASDHS